MSTTEARAHVCTTPKTPIEYINSLPEWDGVPRLDTWLPHVLGQSPKNAGMYHMEYLALVGRNWLLAMVRRAQCPGSRFEQCLVLEGHAGTGKSSLLQVLAGQDFFSDEAADLSWGRATKEQMQRVWLYEIGELAAFSKSDIHSIKSFITSRNDAYRPPYSAETKFAPRQFLVAGSTNNECWRERQSTRRFWPVPVPFAINTRWVYQHRDQLFAEAKARIGEADFMQDLNSHPGMPGPVRSGAVPC